METNDQPGIIETIAWHLIETAPKQIYLCVSDDQYDANEPFPYSKDVTWSTDTPVECCIRYTRFDIAPAWKDLADSPGMWLVVEDSDAYVWEVRLSLCANHLEVYSSNGWVELDGDWKSQWLKLPKEEENGN